MYNPDTGKKWLTAARLIALLEQLPPDTRLMPSRRTGNLVVLADETDAETRVYIDFYAEGLLGASDSAS